MIKIIFIALFAVASFAVDDYMYFDIHSMKLKMVEDTNRLEGMTSALKVYVMMNNNEFEIVPDQGEEFVASTYLERDRFTFKKDGMKFSMGLGGENPILNLRKVDVEEAEVELASSGISIEGNFLDAQLYGFGIVVTNFTMLCPTTKFTTDIDKACVKQTNIETLDPRGFSNLRLYDASGNDRYEINIKAKKVVIDDDQLDIKSDDIVGRFDKTLFGLKMSEVQCYKDPGLEELDVEKFLTGCVQVSKINGEDLNFVTSGLDVSIDRASLKFGQDSFYISAGKALFRSAGQKAIVEGMDITCEKDIIPSSTLEGNPILNGCLRKSEIGFEKIEAGKEITKAVLKVDTNRFSLKGRLKFLFKIKVLAKGSVIHNTLTNQLVIEVEKASIAGMSARKLAISLIKRFVNSSKVTIDRYKIYIQL